MAVTLFNLPATAFVGDVDETFVASDTPATHRRLGSSSRRVLGFDNSESQAALSGEYSMPQQYAAGTITAYVYGFINTAASGAQVRLEVYFEAVTPDADTLSMEGADNFDSANAASSIDLVGTTALDIFATAVTLTNKGATAAVGGAVAAGDKVRIAVRRDHDHADDDAAAVFFMTHLEIRE